MKAELVPINGDPPIPIKHDVTVVGRREYCDVVIDHPSLSKRHCVLVRTDGLLMVRDLATTNGTKVNGQRVLWAALLPNDRLTMGGFKVRVYLGPDDMPSPSETALHGAERPYADAARPVPVAAAPAAGPIGFAAPSPLEAFPTPRAPSDDDVPEGGQPFFDDDDEIIELD
jgi:predicted component of type VI protein secretion system